MLATSETNRQTIGTQVRAGVRLLAVAGHILLGAVITLILVLKRALGRPARSTPHIVHWWYRRLLPMLGIEISAVHGSPQTHALLAANHVSWLDVPVLGALMHATFLSKDEVRHWPLLGWMSAQLGTLFIRRGNHEAAALAKQIALQIKDGRPVVIFPEGTTSDGRTLKRFHSRLFAAAQAPGSWVQPVAVRYGSNGYPDPTAPFIGEDALLPHLWRVARQPSLQVQVHFLPPIAGDGVERRTLAERSRSAIAAALAIDADAGGPARPVAHRVS